MACSARAISAAFCRCSRTARTPKPRVTTRARAGLQPGAVARSEQRQGPAGLDRAHASFGQDSYAKAVGSGFAALGAGRLDEARVSFEKARSMKPGGAEAQTGLQRVGAALSARGYAGTRQRAQALEAEERWTDAFNEYDAALKIDPSLVFAQQGRARAASRADLSNSLQALIDRPERLAAPMVRAEAESLVKRAAGVGSERAGAALADPAAADPAADFRRARAARAGVGQRHPGADSAGRDVRDVLQAGNRAETG